MEPVIHSAQTGLANRKFNLSKMVKVRSSTGTWSSSEDDSEEDSVFDTHLDAQAGGIQTASLDAVQPGALLRPKVPDWYKRLLRRLTGNTSKHLQLFYAAAATGNSILW